MIPKRAFAPSILPRGIYYGPLDGAPEKAACHLGTLLNVQDEKELEILVLALPAGVTLNDPLHVRFASMHSHLLIVLGEGARAEMVEHLEGEDQASHDVEVFLGDRAELTFLSVETTQKSTHFHIRQQGSIGAGASLQWQNVTLGGGHIEHDLRSEVVGAGGKSTVDWVFYAKEQEIQRLSACNIFSAPEGGGEITVHGVAEANAQVGCRGMLEIGPRGAGTNTYLREHVLMLDRTAKVDAIPGLEIRTNDVKASHSATVTRVTPEDLFYFAARGIPEHTARQMYVRGFLADLTQRVHGVPERACVLAVLECKERA